MISDYLKSLGKVLGVGAAFASIPFFASLASLQPPWPPAIGFVSSALVLVAALVIWEWTRKSKLRNRRQLILLAAGLMIVGLGLYLALYSMFVEAIAGTPFRVIRGYVCTADAQRIYGAACPDLPRESLMDAEWDSLALWTRSSITNVRLALTGAWLLFTASLIMTLGAVIAGRKF
jgi:hypothetical protein